MCGIFGLIRHSEATQPERASAAFVELGRLAIERGRDSAGFALTNPDNRPQVTGSTHRHVDARETVIDGIRIIKDTVAFDDLWDDDKHLPLLAGNRVAIGHTRWATQGKRDALTNASPIIVGSLVGTHNGDVDTSTVNGKYGLPKPYGTTDTEVLYLALDRDRRDRRKITDILRNVEGRAALAWVDRHKPDRVYLSRAALSPLSIAWDAEGNLYWASNPRWFRDIDAKFGGAIGFHTITLVEEGVLLTVSVADAAPVIEDMRRFTPKCRPSDARLSDGVVWRGFDPEDCAADKAQKRHTVAPRTSGWGSYGTYGKGTKKPRKTGGGMGGWDMSQPGYVPSTPATTSMVAANTVPDYTDGLDDITSREFAKANSENPWADIDSQEDLWEAADLTVDWEEEAMSAANQWIEDGGDDSIIGALRNASMPSEIEALMDEFDISSVPAFHKFRDLVQNWSTERTKF
jgi:glucosamine--fructose-6-phosphate aminotransferase (isomerizing)